MRVFTVRSRDPSASCPASVEGAPCPGMSNNPPANWYPDPHNPLTQRWWDGSSWTDQTRPALPAVPSPGNAATSTLSGESKKVVAGVLAIVLGGLGVHKFYLGYTGAGILQIVVTLVTCGAGAVIGLVEGVLYLTKSDEEFVATYQIGRKTWF